MCKIPRTEDFDELLRELGETLLTGADLERQLAGSEKLAKAQKSEARHERRGTVDYHEKWAEWHLTMAHIVQLRQDIDTNQADVSALEDDVAGCYDPPVSEDDIPAEAADDDGDGGDEGDGGDAAGEIT